MVLRPAALPREDASEAAIVATIGPHVWLWRAGTFQIIDVREW
jgi:hypothetical protein